MYEYEITNEPFILSMLSIRSVELSLIHDQMMMNISSISIFFLRPIMMDSLHHTTSTAATESNKYIECCRRMLHSGEFRQLSSGGEFIYLDLYLHGVAKEAGEEAPVYLSFALNGIVFKDSPR